MSTTRKQVLVISVIINIIGVIGMTGVYMLSSNLLAFLMIPVTMIALVNSVLSYNKACK